MPLSSETLPNKPLNGRELLEVSVAKFRQAMERDCFFSPQIAYGRVALTITAVFHTSNMAVPEIVSRTYARPEMGVEGEPPLVAPEPDAQVVAKEVKVELENPNMERVNADLPIVVEGRKGTGPVTPQDPFPQIERHEIRYDKTQYPPAAQPVVVDVSEREAGKLGVPMGPAMSPADSLARLAALHAPRLPRSRTKATPKGPPATQGPSGASGAPYEFVDVNSEEFQAAWRAMTSPPGRV